MCQHSGVNRDKCDAQTKGDVYGMLLSDGAEGPLKIIWPASLIFLMKKEKLGR